MGGRQNIKLTSEDNNGMMSVLFSVVRAGVGIPGHFNSHEDETFENTEGEVTLDGEVQLVKKGDIVFMPKNIPHSFKDIKDTSMWVILEPGGAENMFVGLATLPLGPPDIAIGHFHKSFFSQGTWMIAVI